jgi:YVTN family beta-propeller protein
MEVSPDGKELWIGGVAWNTVFVYDIASKQITHKIPAGKEPIWVTFSPDGKYCAVSNAESDECSIFDTVTHKEVARLKVGSTPKRLVVVSTR